MAVSLELAVRGVDSDLLAAFYIESELLAVHAFEDTTRRARIELCVKPHCPSPYRQLNWNRDSIPGSGAIIMRMAECECRRQILPPCEVGFVPRLDACDEWDPFAVSNGRVHFLRRVTDREQPIAIQRNPMTGVPLPVLCQPSEL